MEKSDLSKSIQQFKTAVDRLGEVLKEDPKVHSAFIDASIQRFEFSFELAWRALKRCLLQEGIQGGSPREVFRKAFQLGWLTEGDRFWNDMIEDRNQTSHTYNQKEAQEIYSVLPTYLGAFQRLVSFLEQRYK